VLAAACAFLCVFLMTGRAARADGIPVYYATVTVSASGKPVGSIASHFIGLSYESGTLNSGRYTSQGNLARLLSNLGSGILRFGGSTADTAFTGITPAALAALAGLAGAANWPVLYTEDLGHFNASQVAADAQAVSAALGGKLLAIGCGNEPDEYSGEGLRPPRYTLTQYLSDVGACYSAIRAGAPGVPLEGPDTGSLRSFLTGYVGKESHTISFIGQHYYSLGCTAPVTDPADWVGTLLSPGLADAEGAKLGGAAALARSAHLPLLITETASACHGGIPGLSDTYAAALWVIDYLLTGAAHGVHAMEFHGGLDTSCAGYTVLCKVASGTYAPQPVYYGLLFTHLLGQGTLLPVTASIYAKFGNLAAFALKPGGGGLKVMLENLSSARAEVTVEPAGYQGAASMVRLAAPSLLATSGVTIEGESIGASGTFTPGQAEPVRCAIAGCAVSLPPYSAALVTAG
jgi:hypothetical protein